MIKRVATALMLAMLCIWGTACLDVEEKTNMLGNGECDMRFTMRVAAPSEKEAKEMKKDMKEDELRSGIKGLEGVELTDYTVKIVYGQVLADMRFHADHCLKLGEVYSRMPDKMESPSQPGIEAAFSKEGFYKIKKRGKKLLITRTIGQSKKKKGRKKKEDFGEEFAAMMLGGIKMRFDLTVPTRIISSNAESVDGNTLHWVIPLTYLENHKVVLKAEIESTPELSQGLLGK